MSLFQEIGAYVDVLLPLPLENAFTYAVPPALVEEIQVGKRVVVPFQKGKFYSGLIINIHAENPTSYPVHRNGHNNADYLYIQWNA